MFGSCLDMLFEYAAFPFTRFPSLSLSLSTNCQFAERFDLISRRTRVGLGNCSLNRRPGPAQDDFMKSSRVEVTAENLSNEYPSYECQIDLQRYQPFAFTNFTFRKIRSFINFRQKKCVGCVRITIRQGEKRNHWRRTTCSSGSLKTVPHKPTVALRLAFAASGGQPCSVACSKLTWLKKAKLKFLRSSVWKPKFRRQELCSHKK